MSGLLKLIIAFVIVNSFEYRKITTDATRIVNVRNTHKLQSRSLLFPPTAPTRVQFIGGIGIPVEDLSFESVTSGYVLKAEYFLPETADVFRQKLKPQTIHRRRKSVNETDIYEDGYNSVSLLNDMKNRILSREILKVKTESRRNQLDSTVGDHFGNQRKHGTFYRWIVFKAIETILDKSALNGRVCMLRSICEHAAIPLSYEGGLLAEILHIILTPSASRDELVNPNHKEYLRAELVGRSGEDCEKAFSQCTKSPMEVISAVFET